uniref:Uncharacterized protein n=1 Tax=viral metagenome TaxID=1070528 RepID=A0A6C0C1Y6_9ZZZZ
MNTEKKKSIKIKIKKNKTMKKRKGGNISMFAPIAIGSVAVVSSLVKKNKVCYKGKTHNQSNFESLMNNSDAVKKCPPKVKYGRCNTCKKLSRFIDEGSNEKKIKKYEKKCRKCRGNRSTKCNFKEYVKYSGATMGECGSLKGGDSYSTKNPPGRPLKPQDRQFFSDKKDKMQEAIAAAQMWGYYTDVENPTIPVINSRVIAYVDKNDEVYTLGKKKKFVGTYDKDGNIVDKNGKVIGNIDNAGLLKNNDDYLRTMNEAGIEMDMNDEENGPLTFGGKKRSQ